MREGNRVHSTTFGGGGGGCCYLPTAGEPTELPEDLYQLIIPVILLRYDCFKEPKDRSFKRMAHLLPSVLGIFKFLVSYQQETNLEFHTCDWLLRSSSS
jgi:hypothetical protein